MIGVVVCLTAALQLQLSNCLREMDGNSVYLFIAQQYSKYRLAVTSHTESDSSKQCYIRIASVLYHYYTNILSSKATKHKSYVLFVFFWQCLSSPMLSLDGSDGQSVDG